MYKNNNLLLVGESGYQSTRYLLEKVVSLMDHGYKVLFITDDYQEQHLKNQLFEIMLKDKEEFQIRIPVNKRYRIEPIEDAQHLIDEYYKEKLRSYFPNRARLTMLLSGISGELTDFKADYIVIDNLYSVMKRSRYETNEMGIERVLNKIFDYLEGAYLIFSVDSIKEDKKILDYVGIQYIKDAEPIIHNHPWLGGD